MFRDRREAGQALGDALRDRFQEGQDDPHDGAVVLGLPRGGVPVAAEVAHALAAPLDVIVVRKVGAPFQPEFAIGAIGEGGVRVFNEDAMRAGVSIEDFARVEVRERAELQRRALAYRENRERVSLADRTAIIVDDGVATGSTAAAACRVARALGARRVVLAAPVAARAAVDLLRSVADDIVTVATPADFRAVGEWYRDFAPTTDQEVIELLRLQPHSA